MNKIIISKKPRPIFQDDSNWTEYKILRKDINESLLRILYAREDVGFVLKHLEEEFKYDERRKDVYFYSNADVEGLKNFMQYSDYYQNEPEILE